MRSVWGIVTAALVVLVTVYVFNKFSGKNIADLGKA